MTTSTYRNAQGELVVMCTKEVTTEVLQQPGIDAQMLDHVYQDLMEEMKRDAAAFLYGDASERGEGGG